VARHTIGGNVATLRFGFEQGHLESIIGLAHPENAGLARELEKSGLTYINRSTQGGMAMSRLRLLRSDIEWLSHAPRV